MYEELYGIWFDGDDGKVPPHWLLDDNGITSWSGPKDEAVQTQGVFGGKIIPIPSPVRLPEMRARQANELKHVCKHDREPKVCEQCRLEALSTEALLVEVEAYEANMRTHGIVSRGWWVELAHRLREASCQQKPQPELGELKDDDHKDMHIEGLTKAIELYCPDVKCALKWAETYASFSSDTK
jgi:hypothetical protein